MEEQEWYKFKRTNIAEMREVTEHEARINKLQDSDISISNEDKNNGSPKLGDFVARNPNNYDDKWLVSAEYAEINFEKIGKCEK